MEVEVLENEIVMTEEEPQSDRHLKFNSFMDKLKKYTKYNWQIYILFLPAFLWMIFFVFVPFISNVVMSFQDYSVSKGIFGSKFIGFQNYSFFFTMDNFFTLLGNTLLLNLLVLVIGFPAAIFLAIMIYESKSKVIKGIAQTTTFLPFFISAVVVCNMTIEFLKADTGMIVNILSWFGVERTNVLNNPAAFRWIYALMELWQTIGYNSLIYLAALSAIDTSLYEAASMDGAGKFRQIFHVTLPGIAPTIIITLILKIGKLLSMGYEKVLLLQNVYNKPTSEIISTYVYNVSLSPTVGQPNYGLAATIGLFDAVVAIILVTIVNKIAKKVSDTQLW
ncbi:MAG: ABC transporter permease subunit [Anaeroplasmataceae bacterium]|jgi:ABC-type polysaccharide transport system, permease component|nr:ABC transporter permease subunit [Anaeroplasmataceae bacterium]HRF70439.1 ABC transporter permease subunit [Candidatus Pelethenecus sp.]